MMWNNNDTKYIIKRLILYLLISGIVFFSATQCTKASVVSRYQCSNYASNNAPCDTVFSASDIFQSASIYRLNNNNYFQNYGQGYVIFSFIAYGYSGNYNLPIYEVDLRANGGNTIFVCDIGTYSQYYDNNNNYTVYTAKCPVQLDNYGLYDIIFHKYSGNINLSIKRSEIMTWVGEENNANQIVSGINNAINTMNSQSQTNAQAISNAINSATQQEINAINANTTAINNQTAAINAQTEWQQQDFQVDVSQINAVQDLISSGDKNKIRDLLMFPVRLLMLVGAHLSTNYCYNFNLGNLLGTNLILPCINLKNIIGSNLYDTIDVIFSIGIYIGLIIYLRKLLDYVFTLGNTSFESVSVEVFK